MKKSIVILTGGGPAPGMNTVVGSIAKTFITNGYRVLGLHGGYKGLFSENPNFTDIDFLMADSIFNRGGSYLVMSRYKPTKEDFEQNFNLDFFKDNNIQLLVTIGGDDTASTANRVAKYLSEHNHSISNIHVPKTIDNDLPLPMQRPTFGYESAKSEGARLATTIYEDARTSNNWFVVCAMGRSAGHLAFGIGSAAHYPMIVIPEMFNKTTITIDKIVKLAVSSIVKREILGINYGAVMISEGVFHELSDDELKKSGVTFSYDDHGHPELGKVSKAHIFSEMVDRRIAELGLKTKIRPVELGYELRCQSPSAYDLVYCTELGIGVHQLFSEGKTGCMVYIDHLGKVKPLYLVDIQDPVTGKINPRGVSLESDRVQAVINNIMHYVTESDYSAASKLISNPQEYDFRKILNW
ncbi:MAG: 6-phosphofructokinase [Bacteroidetes bacterium HGW-Bacteroidetes-6]|jgi:6-phosphofructokinase 1|nr:MAG: 6-phosphofructokinase [Bacteroidetes bacterium HGW-Bacteroidetes-7]PKP04915.1 MAG: 6-phosphofructokinase [Bacteroidetes bacterium HGW-Bacteroidetes-6]